MDVNGERKLFHLLETEDAARTLGSDISRGLTTAQAEKIGKGDKQNG